MFEVYYGTDTHAVRTAAYNALGGHAADTVYTVIETEQYQAGQLAEAVGATSLFGDQEIYLIDTPKDILADELQALLSDMASARNVFIIIEGPLLAPAKKQYAKEAVVLEEYKTVAQATFNAFSMADALARKDKKSLWLLLQSARTAGLSAEEVIGTLWWQLKSMRLAAVTTSAAEAGMKDFPYNKAKRALSLYAPGQLAALSEQLLLVYHQGHAGEVDIYLALEEWCLGL